MIACQKHRDYLSRPGAKFCGNCGGKLEEKTLEEFEVYKRVAESHGFKIEQVTETRGNGFSHSYALRKNGFPGRLEFFFSIEDNEVIVTSFVHIEELETLDQLHYITSYFMALRKYLSDKNIDLVLSEFPMHDRNGHLCFELLYIDLKDRKGMGGLDSILNSINTLEKNTK